MRTDGTSGGGQVISLEEEGVKKLSEQDHQTSSSTALTETNSADLVPADYSALRDPLNCVLVGASCHVRGEILNCERLEIAGILEGDFEIDEIVVHEGGSVSGTLKARLADIRGNLVGDLTVHDALEVGETGVVYGNICYGQLAVSEGGQIIGNIRQEVPVRARRKRYAKIFQDLKSESPEKSDLLYDFLSGKA